MLARSRSGIIGDKERTGILGSFRLSHPARVDPGSPAQDKEPELREVPGFPQEKAGDADEIASRAMIHHYRLAAIPFFSE
jgi:hypothetical protein